MSLLLTKFGLVLAVVVVLIATLLRFIKLGSLPEGLTWDEAAIGYNAYGIATVHRDEWLSRTPLTFKSFGDYKSPLGIYVTSVVLLVLPLTAWSVRFPVALAGLVSVVATGGLAWQLSHKSTLKAWWLWAMLLMALSPWAIHFSRLAFEATYAVLLISLGVGCLLLAKQYKVAILAGLFFLGLAPYAYHSAKTMVPLVLVVLTLRYGSYIKKLRLWVLGGLGVFVLTLSPLAYASIYSRANERAVGTTILVDESGASRPPIQVMGRFMQNYLTHLSPGFLLQGNDLTYRHSTKVMGVLQTYELVSFMLGVVIILRNSKYRSYWWLPVLALSGLIPASLGNDVPHANRALLALPWVQLTAALGIVGILPRFKQYQRLGVASIIILVLGASVLYVKVYTQSYQQSAVLADMAGGYRELIAYLRSQESTVDRVYMPNTYGQTYIYLLFYKRMSPIDWRGGGLANYVITDQPLTLASGQKRVLVGVPANQDLQNLTPEKQIFGPDSELLFSVVRL